MIQVKPEVYDELGDLKLQLRALDFEAACYRMLGSYVESASLVHKKLHIMQDMDERQYSLRQLFDAKYNDPMMARYER